ncbi:MAG: phosphoribosylanthranilate isomerase [Rhodospirillaceae bacterium]|nr:phosphoribosylanthranilate isomerase [Rhodospirillaceae bacterium]
MALECKICGLSDVAGIDAAMRYGARMVGFNFFPKSPRYVSFDQAAALSPRVSPDVERVGVMVDPDDEMLRQAIAAGRLSIVQLHGKEDPGRVAQVKEQFAIKVMKVIRVSEATDLDEADAYVPVADLLMFDAKPPKGATRPGGNAVAFDWRILAGRTWKRPWLLSGGLDVANVARAVEISGTRMVDAASGIETAPGKKDPALIKAFLEELASL